MERHALFFTDKDSKRVYKENVKFTLTRKNSANGRLYKDDPTIMAWGLLNEPRCETWKARAVACQDSCQAASPHAASTHAHLPLPASLPPCRCGAEPCSRLQVAAQHEASSLVDVRPHVQVPECPANYRAWVEEMANYVKRLDPQHLVTIGEEGFFGPERPEAAHNPQVRGPPRAPVLKTAAARKPVQWFSASDAPDRELLLLQALRVTCRMGEVCAGGVMTVCMLGRGQEWGGQIGQDFVPDHMPASIDFATIHVWPDNWQRCARVPDAIAHPRPALSALCWHICTPGHAHAQYTFASRVQNCASAQPAH